MICEKSTTSRRAVKLAPNLAPAEAKRGKRKEEGTKSNPLHPPPVGSPLQYLRVYQPTLTSLILIGSRQLLHDHRITGMNEWMECFHLAYIPATNIEPVDVSISDCAKNHVISVRSASSIRLYRCNSRHLRTIEKNVQGDYTSEKITAGIDVSCPCCCCRADRCSSDPLFPHLSFNESLTTKSTNDFEFNADIDYLDNKHLYALKEASMLVVLVPRSLTQRITDLIYSIDSMGKQNGVTQIIDAEEDLRRSIHPSLCKNELSKIIHSDNHKRLNDRHCSNIEENEILSPQIHVRGIITSHHVSNCVNFPFDAVLLTPVHPSETSTQNDRSKCHDRMHFMSQLSKLLNHNTASSAPWSVLKAFPVSSLSRLSSPDDFMKQSSIGNADERAIDMAALPCCTVCLNFIEPARLGLPDLNPQLQCSRWCLSSYDIQEDSADPGVYSQHHTCTNEMNFIPSPQCAACRAIFQRETNGSLTQSPATSLNDLYAGRRDLYSPTPSPFCNSCNKCGMTSNLWVCLTCGVIGCGRYTLKHAEEHYTFIRHPYSFELATGRIWDYDNGKFVHRIDLLECPVLSQKLGRAVASAKSPNFSSTFATSPLVGLSSQGGEFVSENSSRDRRSKESYGDSNTQCHNNLEVDQINASKLSAPKKSIMISQEYEALLQSALEDQAQHYQGEISRLRAQSATSQIHESKLTEKESREIVALRMDSKRLKDEMEKLTSSLLEDQRKEAKYRSLSQRLLREQSISKELLEKIRKETATVIEQGRQRVEDLEMQIADLTANLRMMSQFALSEELNQAQICGTIGGSKGKKQRGEHARKDRKRG